MHAIERCRLTSQRRLALNVPQPASPRRCVVPRPEKGFRTRIRSTAAQHPWLLRTCMPLRAAGRRLAGGWISTCCCQTHPNHVWQRDQRRGSENALAALHTTFAVAQNMHTIERLLANVSPGAGFRCAAARFSRPISRLIEPIETLRPHIRAVARIGNASNSLHIARTGASGARVGDNSTCS